MCATTPPLPATISRATSNSAATAATTTTVATRCGSRSRLGLPDRAAHRRRQARARHGDDTGADNVILPADFGARIGSHPLPLWEVWPQVCYCLEPRGTHWHFASRPRG